MQSSARTSANARGSTGVSGRVAPFLAAALLAGCATYTPAPLHPAESARTFSAQRLDSADARDDIARLTQHAVSTWPLAEWNRADLFAIALARNPDLAVARAEIDVAAAGEITAAQRQNPTVELQSEYARRESQHWLYGLGLDLMLRAPGARRLDIERAGLATSAARSQLMARVWDVRSALVHALSDRDSARRRIDVLSRLSAAQDRLIDLETRRVDAGEDTPADLVAARAAGIEFEQQAAAARADRVRADAAIAAAVGVPPEAIDAIAIEWPDWGDPSAIDAAAIDRALEDALAARAALAAAIDDYAAKETALKTAIAHQYPSFDLKPGYYWDHGIAKWPFALGLALPLFHRNEGEIAEARAAREVAGRRMLALQATIYGDIEASLRAERVAREHLDAATRRGDAARRQRDQADLALKLGAYDRMERDAADIVALRAELETLDAKARLQSARNALEDALHVPLSGPERNLAPAAPDDSGADR